MGTGHNKNLRLHFFYGYHDIVMTFLFRLLVTFFLILDF